MATTDFESVDAYIATFPAEVQEVLQSIRNTVQQAVPGAEEVISYQMPAFRKNGILVWYAAWKKHIGLYPKTAGVEEAFKNELSKFERSKGTIKFPWNQPIPLDLISRIAKFREKENL